MKKKVYYSIGVMSGTSLDGFDFSLIKSDGIFKIEVVKNQYFSIHDNLRKKIKLIIVKINQDYYKTVNSGFLY